MDSHNGTLPVCPRCAHPGHLILGLLKTPPVCIDCAVDPTLTNPQENWPKDGVKVSGGGVFKGEIGPRRIIVQHPKYSVLEQEFGDVLMVYNTRAYKLPRRSGNTLNNHVAKFKMPIATTQPQKCNMQNLGQFNATNITQGETELAMTSKQTNLSHNIHVPPINKTILASKPRTINLFNYKVDLSSLAVSEGHAKPLESFVEKSCLVQLLEKSNKKQVQKQPVSKVTNPPMLNDRMSLCNAHEKNWRYNQEVEAMVRNDQTTVPGFRVNAKPPQRMHGTASLFRSEAVPINAQHASLTKAGNLVQHVRLPEGVTDCPCKVTIQENVDHPEFHKLHEDELSKRHQNKILPYEFDQCNTFPTTSSTEHVTSPSANNWPYKVATHHIIPSDAETRSEFHYKLPTQKASPCSILPEADEQTTVKATNWIGRMAAQKNLMPAKTLPNQNMNDWHCNNNSHHSEFVNPRPLPQQATSVERVQSPTEAMDSMNKMATEENQMEAAKLSNHEVDILYPCSIFSSNLADHKSPTTATEQGKSTEDVIIVDSEIATTEECSQIEPVELGNQQTQSSYYPYSVFTLMDPKTLATTPEQGKPTEDVTGMASSGVTTENWALIELEKLCNQQVLTSWNIYDVANSKPNPVSTEQVTPMEDVVEMVFMMATQENSTQTQREISSDQDVGKKQPPSNPCNQLNKPDALPKTTPFPDNANSPQKATDLIQQTAPEDKNPHIEEPSKSTNMEKNPCAKTSVGKLHKFDTIEDLMHRIKFPPHNNVLSNKPNQQKTTESTKEKDTEREDTESGPRIVHQYPKMSDLEFIIPDKTNDIAEAESPQKFKSGTTTLAVDQQNCTDARVNLKEQVTYNSEEILVQDKNTDRLKSAIEIERHKLRTLRAIIKQLKKLLTRPKCAEDVTDDEYRERSEISDHTHPRSMDTLLEDADCPNKESRILYASNSNDDKHCETQTETIMPPVIKRTLKMELCLSSKRLRDEGMVLTMPHTEQKKPNQEQKEQLDTMNIGTDELHGFERSRLARDQPIKKIHSGPVEENARTSQKAESLTNTHMTTKSGKVLLEKDIKCDASDWKLSTRSNPLTEYNEDHKLPKEDTDPMIISKELKVEMLNMVPCQKQVEKPEEVLKQANKTLITPQHESFQASKPVYENQRTADQLEKAKASEVELRNEKSLRSTKPLIVAQGGNLGRKRACNETHSSESSKDDKPLSKTRFENQEFEIAAKKPKFGEQESSGRCCKIEMSEAQAAVQTLECKGTATRKCPEDVTKLAKATIVEKPIKRVGQTNIAKPESYSEKERNEEQINHTAPVYVAIQQNKAKTQMYKNQELHACTREEKSQKPISDEATNLAKARSVEVQQNTSPSKSYKEGETPKQQITVQIQKVKSQSTISDEATNLAKAIRVETQQNTSPSKSYKEGETPKQQITVIINNKRDPRTQSRRECSNENVHCNLHETTETPHDPNGPSTSDCGSPTNASHDMKRFPTLNFVQMQTAAMPQGEDKRTRHPSKEVATTNSDYTASRTSVDESIQDEDVRLKKPCTSSSQVKLNENKTEMPRLQNQERETEMKSDDDQGKTHGTIEPQGTPQDSKMISTSDCVMSRTRVACERERSPDQKSTSHCAQNQHGNNAVADHCKGDKMPPPTITQKPCKYHYLQKEWNPKSYPDLNALSTGGTFCSNIPQDSKGLGDQEKEISVDNGFGKEQRTRLHPASERLFIPDGAMPRNPAYEKEMHSRQQSPLQYMSKPSVHVQNQDNQSDARNNNHKALSLPSETHDGREFAILSLWGFDKQRIKDPRILSRMERELKSALTNMLLASMSSLETLSHVQEPLEKGEIKDEQVLSDIEMHVFDKKCRKIELNPREVNIYKWSKIVIKTVRSDCPRSDVIEAKNVNWEQMTNISTGGANTHLIFKERMRRKSKIRKLICLKRVMYWNNTLEISIYAHAFGQWLCVTHDSATSQRRKYFFANVEHGSAEKVTWKDDDGEFEGRNEGESSEAVKSHEVANIEKHCDLPQRYRGQYSNEADESARSGKEHWDRKRTKSRKRHARKGIYGEKVSPDSPR